MYKDFSAFEYMIEWSDEKVLKHVSWHACATKIEFNFCPSTKFGMCVRLFGQFTQSSKCFDSIWKSLNQSIQEYIVGTFLLFAVVSNVVNLLFHSFTHSALQRFEPETQWQRLLLYFGKIRKTLNKKNFPKTSLIIVEAKPLPLDYVEPYSKHIKYMTSDFNFNNRDAIWRLCNDDGCRKNDLFLTH